jgi:hypothetical protein
MSSQKQFDANRRNARKSTGPTTEYGKLNSRRNAIRHGLCAETVVEILEDIEDYRGFEAAIIADYDAQTAVERELVLRLASLLWRIRRATSIETGLLRIQAEILHDRQHGCETPCQPEQSQDVLYRVLGVTISPNLYKESGDGRDDDDARQSHGDECDDPSRSTTYPMGTSRELTHCFQRLANLDNGLFERLGRYEAALWRQVAQTLFVLQAARRR